MIVGTPSRSADSLGLAAQSHRPQTFDEPVNEGAEIRIHGGTQVESLSIISFFQKTKLSHHAILAVVTS
jgi:hypothetical protein